jgi:hypothetical protein
VQCVAALRPGGHPGPVFWFSADRRDVVVDRAFSSDLTVVDLTRLQAGERFEVGTLAPALREAPGREVLALLLRADVLRSYAHLEGTVCLDEEQADAGGYRAALHGEHVFFTSKKNVRPFAFGFERTAAGLLVVTGR